MGYVLAILVGVFAQRALNTRLFAGGYSLALSFWGFGVLGGSIVLGIAMAYVGYVIQSDQSSGAGWTFSATRGATVPVALYAVVVFAGIWRSAANSSFWVRIIARYFSIFFLSTAAACMMLGWSDMLIAAGVYWLTRHYQRPRTVVAEG